MRTQDAALAAEPLLTNWVGHIRQWSEQRAELIFIRLSTPSRFATETVSPRHALSHTLNVRWQWLCKNHILFPEIPALEAIPIYWAEKWIPSGASNERLVIIWRNFKCCLFSPLRADVTNRQNQMGNIAFDDFLWVLQMSLFHLLKRSAETW